MRTTLKSICLILFVFLLVMEHGICQESASNNSTDTSKLINAAKEIMTEAGTCALITLDKDGSPRARTMDPFLPEENFTVWFWHQCQQQKKLIKLKMILG